ncbi:hypothetical protein SUGI_0137830, partial [Cryptomeria japonica]
MTRKRGRSTRSKNGKKSKSAVEMGVSSSHEKRKVSEASIESFELQQVTIKMAAQTSSMMGQVQLAHRFDESSLIRYAQANVEGFPHPLENFKVLQ